MTTPVQIAPSILSADFARLGAEVEAVAEAGADRIHIDPMDGHFVPNLTFGAPIVKAIRGVTDLPFDVHMMMAPVDPFIEAFVEAGADTVSIHPEAGPHTHRSLQTIRRLGARAGVALNPATHEIVLTDLLDMIDLVCVMGVNPGFGGQAHIPGTAARVRRLRALLAGRPVDIVVDGGVGTGNARALAEAGADILVAGSAVFEGGADAYAGNIAAIRAAAETIGA